LGRRIHGGRLIRFESLKDDVEIGGAMHARVTHGEHVARSGRNATFGGVAAFGTVTLIGIFAAK
jgi:hypothetical protein